MVKKLTFQNLNSPLHLQFILSFMQLCVAHWNGNYFRHNARVAPNFLLLLATNETNEQQQQSSQFFFWLNWKHKLGTCFCIEISSFILICTFSVVVKQPTSSPPFFSSQRVSIIVNDEHFFSLCVFIYYSYYIEENRIFIHFWRLLRINSSKNDLD